MCIINEEGRLASGGCLKWSFSHGNNLNPDVAMSTEAEVYERSQRGRPALRSRPSGERSFALVPRWCSGLACGPVTAATRVRNKSLSFGKEKVLYNQKKTVGKSCFPMLRKGFAKLPAEALSYLESAKVDVLGWRACF